MARVERSLALALFLIFALPLIVAADWKPEPLERSEEISEALAACPATLRDQAGVYTLTARGYQLARKSSNGFHAVISRSQPDAFEPQCLDAEGSSTLLEQILLRGRLQMEGLDADEIETRIEAAWASGELEPPRRSGINYMLSKRNRVPVGPDKVIPYQPHLMFYAPHLDNKDVGGSMQGDSPVFVINGGRPDAYVIVPVDLPAADSEPQVP